MYIDSHLAADIHRYRIEETHRTAEHRRLIAALPRKTRSYRLGSYRLTLAKAATPQVPCTN
jgi:hypothetical protein